MFSIEEEGKSSSEKFVVPSEVPSGSGPTPEDVAAETIGAIKEFHGHARFDINKYVDRDTIPRLLFFPLRAPWIHNTQYFH